MRLQLTEEMKKISETVLPYIIYTPGKGYGLRPDSPQEIVDLHRRYCEENDRLVEEWRRENW